MKIWLVDAFSSEVFKGNPAGVCFVDQFPDVSFMQNIASEMNWSQTAFVKQEDLSHFYIRWFSPRDEAPLCGHATLAASHLIWQENKAPRSLITFESFGGLLKAEPQADGWIYLDFPSRPVEPCSLPEILQRALKGVTIQSIFKDHLVYLIVLRDETDVVNLQPNLSLIEQLDCRAVIVTASGDNHYDFVSRYFAPKVGIPEDPVCGSAHCRLTPFWSHILKKNKFFAYQASSRGGQLKLGLDKDRVLIGGQSVTVSVSELKI